MTAVQFRGKGIHHVIQAIPRLADRRGATAFIPNLIPQASEIANA